MNASQQDQTLLFSSGESAEVDGGSDPVTHGTTGRAPAGFGSCGGPVIVAKSFRDLAEQMTAEREG